MRDGQLGLGSGSKEDLETNLQIERRLHYETGLALHPLHELVEEDLRRGTDPVRPERAAVAVRATPGARHAARDAANGRWRRETPSLLASVVARVRGSRQGGEGPQEDAGGHRAAGWGVSRGG